VQQALRVARLQPVAEGVAEVDLARQLGQRHFRVLVVEGFDHRKAPRQRLHIFAALFFVHVRSDVFQPAGKRSPGPEFECRRRPEYFGLNNISPSECKPAGT